MAAIRKVALAGATGNLGPSVLKALLDAGFEVTALTRGSNKHTFPAQAKVATVDYADVHSLTRALKGQDALISTIPSAAPKEQKLMIDAALSAGVQRYIPSEFGSDIQNEKNAALPVFKGKVEVENYLEEKCTENVALTYTLIYNLAFLDWGLSRLIMDVAHKKINLFDGGDRTFTANNLADVAQGVVAVLQHPEQTANRAVRLNSAVFTQNQLLSLVKKCVGEDGWQVTHVNTADMERESYAKLSGGKPEEIGSAMLGFILLSIFGKDHSGDASGRDDNELLGIRRLSEADVEETVKRVVNPVAA